MLKNKDSSGLDSLFDSNNQFQSKAADFFKQGKYMEAAECLLEIIYSSESQLGDCENPLAQNLNDSMPQLAEQLCRAYNGLQAVYMSTGDYIRAIDYLNKGIVLAERIQLTNMLPAMLCNLGHLYNHMQSYEQATSHYHKALSILLKTEKPSLEFHANILAGLAEVNKKQSNFSSAINYHREELSITKQLSKKDRYFFSLCHLAEVFILNLQFSEAMPLLEEADSLSAECNSSFQQSVLQWTIGSYWMHPQQSKRDVSKALLYFLKSYELIENSNSKMDLDLLKSLINLYKEMGDYQNALLYTEKLLALQSEQSGAEANRRIQWMEFNVRAETLKKEQREKEIRSNEQEKILHKILPRQIADRMLEGENQIADACDEVSVFFCDIVGFTRLSQSISAHELVSLLNVIFSEFDRLALKHGLEKIKTIGDAYMAAAGVPLAQIDHAERAALFALDVMAFMEQYRKQSGSAISLRIGLHCGHAVAGIIGENKFAYDLWGDAVNTASRMESHGVENTIQMSEDFKNKLNGQFIFEERGEMEVKGKGNMKTFFLRSPDLQEKE